VPAVTDLGRFARLGIRRPTDLLLHLPLRYEDETRVRPIGELRAGETGQVSGEVVRSEVVQRPRRMLQAELDDGTGQLTLRFLNFWPNQVSQLTPGRVVRAHGDVRGGLFGLEMVHPRWRVVRAGDALPQRLTPVYPTVAGIGQAELRRAVLEALAQADWPDTLRPGTAGRLGLPESLAALQLLHQPPSDVAMSSLEDRSHPAWRRLVFEELLAQQLSLKRARAARAGQRAEPLVQTGQCERLLAALPFGLTGAQRRAWADVSRDLTAAEPMNRLLQGDVGSGKTVVAALAALQAIGSGRQAALMAPTEILAEQHFRKLRPWLEPLGVSVAWLSGSLPAAAKKAVRAQAARGEVDLLVGTHALIEETVALPQLALAIVDEQHRFGVAQRLALREGRGQALPHQLMMSATPIPRTLAMTYYADLDVSVIDELPPGRTPVRTKLVAEARRGEVVDHVRSAVAEGRQAYWVCPLIEESEALELQTALETFEALTQELDGLRVGLVHGRLPAGEKAAAMDAFTAGAVDVLVATTVIEVGVDVPNASLMVIEHAERFGLAQLHQLRGRVGRGTAESVCVLLYRTPLSATARERLRTLYETTDGFEIARRDLQQRGPGEFLGARQSGLALLRFADLERDTALVEAARDEAAAMLAGPPAAVDLHLERWLAGREDFLKA
jgi:ATP-dependent DNA helicase RecG